MAKIMFGGFPVENISIVLNDVLWRLPARGGYVVSPTSRLHKFAYTEFARGSPRTESVGNHLATRKIHDGLISISKQVIQFRESVNISSNNLRPVSRCGQLYFVNEYKLA